MMGSDIFLQRAIVASEVNSTAAFAFFHRTACDDRGRSQCLATGAQRCPNSKGILQKQQKALFSLPSSVTVSGVAAQEFTLLHNFIDVTEVAAAFPCMGRR